MADIRPHAFDNRLHISKAMWNAQQMPE